MKQTPPVLATGLKIWWIPQVPMKPFEREVSSVREAKVLLETLAEYDLFQFDNNIKPDYCNTGGLAQWNDKTSEWDEWENEDCDDINCVELSDL